ncbi:MAG: response regulator transcription factor [Marmoricola sp.]
MAQLRLVVADDSYLMREALTQLLSTDPGLDVVGVASDFDSALSAVCEHEPDVLVCDVRMPPSGTDEGIRLAEELRGSHPDLGIIVLSQVTHLSYAVALVSAGASSRGYLLKDNVADRGQLVAAVHTVAAGGTVIDSELMDALVSVRSRSGGRASQLTERETQVLAGIASGASNRAIAAGLNLSPRAVEKHITGVFAKLGVGGDMNVDQRVKAALLFLAGDSGA